MNKIHAWLPVIELILIALLLLVVSGQQAGSASAEAILKGEYAPAFWVGLVVIGLVVPIVVSLARKSKGEGEKAGSVLVASEACVLVGGFALRAIVVMAAVSVSMTAMC